MTTKNAVIAVTIVPALLAVLTISLCKQPIIREINQESDLRLTTSREAELAKQEQILEAFFKKHKSPLTGHADTFIEISSKYNIDYRLLPAISCTESSCGKFLIPSSHNPFGWGIYGNKVTSFASYEEAIEKVGAGISKNYVSRGFNTPEKMGRIYNPPSYLAWAGHTRFFMNQMDEIALSL